MYVFQHDFTTSTHAKVPMKSSCTKSSLVATPRSTPFLKKSVPLLHLQKGRCLFIGRFSQPLVDRGWSTVLVSRCCLPLSFCHLRVRLSPLVRCVGRQQLIFRDACLILYLGKRCGHCCSLMFISHLQRRVFTRVCSSRHVCMSAYLLMRFCLCMITLGFCVCMITAEVCAYAGHLHRE